MSETSRPDSYTFTLNHEDMDALMQILAASQAFAHGLRKQVLAAGASGSEKAAADLVELSNTASSLMLKIASEAAWEPETAPDGTFL